MNAVTVAEVAGLVRKQLGARMPDDNSLDADQPFGDIGLSSLQVADIVYSLEDRLGIRFDSARAAEVETINSLVNFANETAGLTSYEATTS
jgi:acyl carrier protein